MAVSLLEAGLSNLIVAGALAALAFLAGRWGRRPALTHGLWLVVLVKLVTPPVVPVSLPVLPAEAAPPQPVETDPVPVPLVTAPLQEPVPLSTETLPVPEPTPATPAGSPFADLPDGWWGPRDVAPAPEPVPVVAPAAEPPPVPVPAAPFPWAEATLAVWVAGSVLWIVLVAVRVARFSRLLRLAPAAPGWFADEVRAVADRIGLRRVPRVRLVSGPVAPMVWSFGRATVYFPAELLGQLNRDQRAAIIAHELAHLKRADHLVRWLEVAALAVYWWCPLAWWAKRELQRAEEECCDAWVVESLPVSGRTYAAALLDTLDFLSEPQAAPALASGLGEADSVRRRLALILAGRTPKRLPLAGRFLLVVLAVGLVPLAPKLARVMAVPTQYRPPGIPPAEGPKEGWTEKSAEPEPMLFDGNPANVRPDSEMWWSLAVSPDGNTLATTTGDRGAPAGEVTLWDRPTGKVRQVIREPGGVRCVGFTPDGSTLVTGNFDFTLRFYDPATGTLWAEGRKDTGGHQEGINGLWITADGRYVATAGLDNTARLWDLKAIRVKKADGKVVTVSPVAVFHGHTQGVTSVAATADGKTLLTGSFDNSVRLWAVPAMLPKMGDPPAEVKKERARLMGHTATVETVSISPDGKWLLSGGWDADAKIWDGTTGVGLRSLPRFQFGVFNYAFSKDGKYLAVGTWNGAQASMDVVRVFEVDGWKQLPVEEQRFNGVKGMAFLPDNKTLAVSGGDQEVHLLDVTGKGKTTVLRHPGAANLPTEPFTALTTSADGAWVAVATEGREVFAWQPAKPRTLVRFGRHDDTVTGLAFSRDGKLLASASQDKLVKVWDMAEKKELRTLEGHTSWVFGVAFSPDGKTLATGGYDKTVRLWDVATGEAKAVWKEHTAAVRSVAYSPDGALLVSAGSDRVVRVWETATGQLKHSLKGHRGAIRSAAFSPDGSLIATGSEDRTVKLWDVTTGTERLTLDGHPDMVTAVRFSPGGGTVVAGTFAGPLVVWDPATGRRRQALSGHPEGVAGIGFGPDGAILTAGADRTVRRWNPVPAAATPVASVLAGPGPTAVALSPDGLSGAVGRADGVVRFFGAADGKVRKAVRAHPGGVTTVVWSPDGGRVLTAGKDGKVRLWTAAGEPLDERAGQAGAFSPDGKWAAVADGGTVALVAPGGTAGVTLADPGVEKRTVTHVAFDPTGKWVATVADDRTLRLWDVKTGALRHSLSPFKYHEQVTALEFSPDGSRLLVAANTPDAPPAGSEMEEFRVQKGMYLFPVPADDGNWLSTIPQLTSQAVGVSAAGWLAGGRGLLTAGPDGNVRLWDATGAPKVVQTFRAHRAPVAALSARPGAGVMVTAGEDGLVRRWNLPAQQAPPFAARLTGGLAGQVWVAEFSPAGNVLVAGGRDDKALRVFRNPPVPRAGPFEADVKGGYGIAFSPDGKYLATGHDFGQLLLREAATGTVVARLEGHPSRIWDVAFSPDSKTLASFGGDAAKTKTPGQAFLWDVPSGKLRRRLDGADVMMWCGTVSPDGRHVVGGRGDGKVLVWDAGTGERVRTLELGDGVYGTRHMVFGPNGAKLYTAGFDRTVREWDAGTWEQTRVIKLPGARPNRLAVSADGKTLYVGGRPDRPSPEDQKDGVILAYDLSRDAPPRELKGHAGAVLSLALLADGKTLVSAGGMADGSGEVVVWDLPTGKPLGRMEGHKVWAEGVAVAPDGRTVATVGGVWDKPAELALWDAAAFRPVALLPDLVKTQYLSCSAFSPDAKTLVLGGWDQVLTVFDMADPAKPTVVKKLAQGNAIRCVAFSPDGSKLVSSDEGGGLKLWSAKDWSAIGSAETGELPVYRAKFSPDGRRVVTAHGNWRTAARGEVRFWMTDGLKEYSRLPDQVREVWDVGFVDPDTLVTIQTVSGKPGEAPVKVWDLKTNAEVRAMRDVSSVRALAMSADGRRLAVGTHPGALKVWDTREWRELLTHADRKDVFRASFSADGTALALGIGDGSVTVLPLPAPKK